jgi:poly(3-hydroxybutyrate) depolymerase
MCAFRAGSRRVGLWVSTTAVCQAIVSFKSGDRVLQGLVYKPSGAGPFPAVLYNHGSAGGMLSNEAFEALGPGQRHSRLRYCGIGSFRGS